MTGAVASQQKREKVNPGQTESLSAQSFHAPLVPLWVCLQVNNACLGKFFIALRLYIMPEDGSQQTHVTPKQVRWLDALKSDTDFHISAYRSA